tara:strand:+ start:2202 stop:3116 length:915 start_codon:yes stop_codon:yes gene_type:complete
MTPLYNYAQALLIVSRRRRLINPVFISKIPSPPPMTLELMKEIRIKHMTKQFIIHIKKREIPSPPPMTLELMRDIRIKYKSTRLSPVSFNDLPLDFLRPISKDRMIREIKRKTKEIMDYSDIELMREIRKFCIDNINIHNHTHITLLLDIGIIKPEIHASLIYRMLKSQRLGNKHNGYFEEGYALAHSLNRRINISNYYYGRNNAFLTVQPYNTLFIRESETPELFSGQDFREERMKARGIFMFDNDFSITNKNHLKKIMKRLGLPGIKYYTASYGLTLTDYQDYIIDGEHNREVEQIIDIDTE